MAKTGAEYAQDWTKTTLEAVAGVASLISLPLGGVAMVASMIEHGTWKPLFPQQRVTPSGHIKVWKVISLPPAVQDLPYSSQGARDNRAKPVGQIERISGADETPQTIAAAAQKMWVYGPWRPLHHADATRWQDADPILYRDLEQACIESGVKSSLFSPASLYGKSLKYSPDDPDVRRGVDRFSMRLNLNYLQNDPDLAVPSASLREDIRIIATLPRELLAGALFPFDLDQFETIETIEASPELPEHSQPTFEPVYV